MKFKKLFLFSILIVIFSLGGVSLSSAFTISPHPPVKGDILKLTGTCTPGSSVPITLKFSRDVAVENGRYEYDIGTIDIPTKSTLSIRAENVKDLKIGVKLLFWFTVTKEGENGVATYSRTVSGKYRIKVFGNALDQATNVKLTFTAKTSIECSENGKLEYTYDSQYLPLGEYTITVNGETKTVELLQERPPETFAPAAPSGAASEESEEVRIVYLIANEIDYSLNENLIERLRQNNLTIERTITPNSCTLVLGGPDAYNGTGEIVRKYLDINEQNSIRSKGSKRIIGKGNVLIVAGSDRYMTREAFEEGFENVLSYLISCLNSTPN